MIKYENHCVQCGQRCMGNLCPNRAVRVLYCDKCKEEVQVLYIGHVSGKELCSECAVQELEKVT